jgi:hypothetical protein
MNSTKCIMISTAAAAVSMLVGWFAAGLIGMLWMEYMVDPTKSTGLGEGVLLACLSPVLAIVFGIFGCVLCMHLLTKRSGKIPISRAHELH